MAGSAPRRFVRRGLVCVLASIAMAIGCEAFQADVSSEESDPTVDGSTSDRESKLDAHYNDAHLGGGEPVEASAKDATAGPDADANVVDASTNPCQGAPNGKVIAGAGAANTCCDSKLTDLHTNEHCGGCKIKCQPDLDDHQTMCRQASTGTWACGGCLSNESCQAAGYGSNATCYPGGGGTDSFCNCQCPGVPLGTAGECKGICSDNMTCHDLKNTNPNPCQY